MECLEKNSERHLKNCFVANASKTEMNQEEVKQINALHFGILSAEEIETNSVVEVTKAKINDTMEHTVYD